MIKIFISDDHSMFVESLINNLKQIENLQIVGFANNGAEAIAKLKNSNPDVLLLDLDMPQKDGFDVINEVKKSQPKIKIIVLTTHSSKYYIDEALKLGVNGYIAKISNISDLIEAINVVNQGGDYFKTSQRKKTINFDKEPTRCEKKILELKVNGLTSSQIADKLNMSKSTVDTHIKNMIYKFDVKNSTELIALAISSDWVTYNPNT